MIPLALARQILSGKRGVRTRAANDETLADDESSIDDFLVDEVIEPVTPGGKKTYKPRRPTMHFTHPDGTPVEVLEFEGKSFVRFADVLPPCPPKGEFDVNKIRLSPYFFS